jgi:hypothetical protein
MQFAYWQDDLEASGCLSPKILGTRPMKLPPGTKKIIEEILHKYMG